MIVVLGCSGWVCGVVLGVLSSSLFFCCGCRNLGMCRL